MNAPNPLRVALVTGGSRGIGAAISERLAADGLAVIVNYAGRRDDAEQVVQRIRASGGQAHALQADVSDTAAVERLFDATEAQYGGIDVLVNNAGIMHLSPIAQFDDAAFDRLIDINMKGSFNTMRQAARRLRDGGHIINFSSSIIGLRQETYGVYAATKAAVEALTAVLSKELRGKSITVNAVAPGPTATDLFLDGKSAELIDRLAKLNPLERLGTPADIAGVVSFLSSPQGLWVNGQTLRANGGMI